MTAFLDRWRDPVAGTALFVLSVALYARTVFFDFQFTWDDGTYVFNNPYIREFSVANLISLVDRPYEGLYGPVQMLSYMIDYRIWGLDPFGYHLSNVLIHAANSVLAFFVLRRLTSSFLLALFAALLFAVHPLNVENVAWIAERKTLVSAFFLLGAVLFYLRFRAVNAGRKASYVASLVCFTLAVFAKATVIGLPVILGFYELFMRDKDDRRFQALIPLFIVAVLAAGATLWVTWKEGVVGGGPEISINFLFGLVYPTMLPVWWEYIRMLLVPTGLSAYYIPTFRSFLDPVVVISILGWIVGLECIFFRASRAARFWFLWAAILFAPTSGLVPWLIYYADRYMYLPAIGLYVLAGMAGTWAFGRAERHWSALADHRNGIVVLTLAAVVGVYGTLAFQRSAVWKNEVSLWQDTTRKTPEFSDGHVNLGAANLRLGRLDEAEAAYQRGLEMGHPKGAIGLRIVEGRRAKQKENEGRFGE